MAAIGVYTVGPSGRPIEAFLGLLRGAAVCLVVDVPTRPYSGYVREAIEEHLEDLEDIALAEEGVERIRRGGEETLSAEELWGGLED
jgi:hypothetical protein